MRSFRESAALLLACGLAVGCGAPAHPGAADAPPLFRALPADSSGVGFRNDLAPTEDLNIITYLYYYNGGGVSVGDVDGDGLPDLYFTANQGPDALYLNEGGMRFRENTQAAGLSTASDWSSGASFTDFDDDGDLDLYVCKVAGVAGLEGRNELYVNDGTGHFREAAEAYGLAFSGLSTQAAFFDADADGDLDVYLLNHSTHATGRARDTAARRRPDTLAGDRLYLQGADGRFADATAGSGLYASSLGYGLGLAVYDFVGDPLPDLYVANDFDERDYTYENLGGGRFEERDLLATTSQFSMGNAAADFDHDGLTDLLTLDMRPSSDSVRKSSSGSSDLGGVRSRLRRGFGLQFPRNALHTGADREDVAVALGIHSTDWSWAPAVLDADLDGYLDVVVGNGIVQRPNDLDFLKYASASAVQTRASNRELAAAMPPGLQANRAFRGRPGAPFEEVAEVWGLDLYGSTTAMVAADLDGDGDEDLVTNNLNAAAVIYENTAAARPERSVTLTVELVQGHAASPAVGAAYVVEQDRAAGGRPWRRRVDVQPVTGFQSSALLPTPVALPRGDVPYRLRVMSPAGHVAAYALEGTQRMRINVDSLPSSPAPPLVAGLRGDTRPTARQYDGFDAAPLEPLLRQPPDRLSDAGTVAGVPGLAELAHLIDTSYVTAVLSAGEREALVAGLYQPVLRLRRTLSGDWAIAERLTERGLWQGILPVEGAADQYVLANIGLNTLLTESPAQRVELHTADWDRNGSAEPIAVRVDSTRATLLGLDPIAAQMPQMRKFFTRYRPFSASRFDRLFPPTEQVGGRIDRADELRSLLYDARAGTVTPLAFSLQSGTPARVIYESDADRYLVTFETPLLRPELMAWNAQTKEAGRLTEDPER